MNFQLKKYRNLMIFLTFLVLMVNLSSIYAKSHVRVNATAEDKFLTWTYKETPMGLYLPGKTDDKPLPIVMFLHGCHNDPVNRYLWIISALNEIEP